MNENPYESPPHHDEPQWPSDEPWAYWEYVVLVGFFTAMLSGIVRFSIAGELFTPPAEQAAVVIPGSTAGIVIGLIMFAVGAIGWIRYQIWFNH